MDSHENSVFEAAIMLVYAAAVFGAFGYFLFSLRALSLALSVPEIMLEF